MKDPDRPDNIPSDDFGNNAESPCVNVCVLNAQQVCVGCFRSSREIAAWSQLDDFGKRAVNQKCQQRRGEG